jgi:hypothetical protein
MPEGFGPNARSDQMECEPWTSQLAGLKRLGDMVEKAAVAASTRVPHIEIVHAGLQHEDDDDEDEVEIAAMLLAMQQQKHGLRQPGTHEHPLPCGEDLMEREMQEGMETTMKREKEILKRRLFMEAARLSSSAAMSEVDLRVLRQNPWLRRYPLLLYTPVIREHAAAIAREYHGKFCWSTDFNPKFLAALISEGYLPMAEALSHGRKSCCACHSVFVTGACLFTCVCPVMLSLCSDTSHSAPAAAPAAKYLTLNPQPSTLNPNLNTRAATRHILLPKLHQQRCILRFEDLHVQRTVRKRAKRFDVTCDTCFERVIRLCQEQHGENWLYPPIVAAFKAIHAAGPDGIDGLCACMHVHVHVHEHLVLHTHVCMSTHIYTSCCTHMCACQHTYTPRAAHTCVHVNTHIHLVLHTHVCMSTNIYTSCCTHTDTHVHVHVHQHLVLRDAATLHSPAQCHCRWAAHVSREDTWLPPDIHSCPHIQFCLPIYTAAHVSREDSCVYREAELYV